MATIDLARLAQNLKQVEADASIDITQRDINPYLLKHVILPYLREKSVSLDKLDYSEFSTESIVDACNKIDAVSCGADRTAFVAQTFSEALPTAQRVKAFC